MFFKTSYKRYPNLSRYVDAASARQMTTPAEVGAITLLALAGLSAPVAILMGFMLPNIFAGLLIGALGMAAGFKGFKTLQAARQDPDRLSVEAAEANTVLSEALKKNRLHRVAGDASVAILEECSRHWARVRHALESPFWSSPNLPLHYQSVREQSARAADRAMDEVLVMVRPELEDDSRQRGVAEFVEEVLDTYVLQRPKDAGTLPMAYGQIRMLAEKLKDLADNVETLTLEVAKDPSIASEFKAEAALDLCIGELRSIRQAETELRQNLGG